eukprot:1031311-Pleurochrysis_carterae.AAC.1
MDLAKSLPVLFADYLYEWEAFFDDFPRSVDDVPNAPACSIADVSINAVPPCSLRLPSQASWSRHQELHSESITYVNTHSTHSADHTTLRFANAAAADIPILKKGNI